MVRKQSHNGQNDDTQPSKDTSYQSPFDGYTATSSILIFLCLCACVCVRVCVSVTDIRSCMKTVVYTPVPSENRRVHSKIPS